MSQDDPVYDLGEVELEQPRSAFPPVFDATRPQPALRPAPRGAGRSGGGRRASRTISRLGPALAGSLSMFVPGLGQLVAGEIAWGLFYASGVGFCAAVLWAAVTTLDRLVPTLRLLDVPAQAVAVTLLGAAIVAMALHLVGILHAHAMGEDVGGATPPHPIVAGIASLAVPGWGQLLSGHRRRAALFLASVWVLAAAWLAVMPAAAHVLGRFDLRIPAAMRDGWGPVLLLALPAVVWVIAVYDAASGAAVERARL
jgi:hypothetical protein